jgi:hypothetical protein
MSFRKVIPVLAKPSKPLHHKKVQGHLAKPAK